MVCLDVCVMVRSLLTCSGCCIDFFLKKSAVVCTRSLKLKFLGCVAFSADALSPSGAEVPFCFLATKKMLDE
jgi:hypothetical protein